ncbi:MAG: helix-turn-helix domain-containing protein [Bacteroidia bacterium]
MKAEKLLIKNMVCPRCVSSVQGMLDDLRIQYNSVSLGEVELNKPLTATQLKNFETKLKQAGFERIETRLSAIVEKIKLRVNEYVSGSPDTRKKLSSFITEKIAYDYSYLSDLFSSVEGITIEKYFIDQRIEKVKELLVYDQLSLSEIAYQTGFSSGHHLSSQFKKVTGLTPSHFKAIGVQKRKGW